MTENKEFYTFEELTKIKRNLLLRIGVVFLGLLLTMFLILSGIGVGISKIGQNNAPGWDNWFVDFTVWLGEFSPPITGISYFVLIIVIISITVVTDMSIRLSEIEFTCSAETHEPLDTSLSSVPCPMESSIPPTFDR